MKRKSLGVNAVLNGFRSAINLIFPLITFPYVSRILLVEGIGIYNFSNTYVGYFSLLAGLGIVTYAVREGAKYRNSPPKIALFSSQVFTINMISTVVAYLLLVLSLVVFRNLHNYVSCILVFSLEILFTTLGTEWIYTIYEDYTYITIRSIIFKILSVILLFVLVRNAKDYLWYAGVTVFANVGSNILNYIHAKSLVQIKLVKNTNWQKHLKPILIIFASSLAMTLYISSDTTILGLIKNEYAVGIYSIAVKVYGIINGLINGLLVVTIPRFALLFGQNKYSEYKKVFSKVVNATVLLVFPVMIGLVMLSKEIVLIIAGKKYINSILSLQIIAIAIIFANFALIFNECVLIPAKREKYTLRNTIITGVVNLVLNLIIIPFWSYNGAALTTVIAEGMMMSLSAWSSRDIIKNAINDKNLIQNVLSTILGCIGIIVICLICEIFCKSLILKVTSSVIFSVLIYGIILILCKNKIALEALKYISFKYKRNR